MSHSRDVIETQAAADQITGEQAYMAFSLITTEALSAFWRFSTATRKTGIQTGYATFSGLLTALCWTIVAMFAAVPFAGLGLPAADAFFESVSALTTTGATVITNLDKQPRGILLSRAMLQGIGGLGIIVVAILILPFLRIGGMQLFQTESSDRSEKIVPRARQLVGR